MISVVINTYNASQHLAKVLESVKDFDEVVVCDMESTDDTVAIAEQYGCKVVTFPKGNHTCCEPARTFAIQSASNPWVLVVDADEIVTPELRKALYEVEKEGRREGEKESVDNTGEEFVGPWLEAVKEIGPQQVMIYTIDRETPTKGLLKATQEQLDQIRDRVIAAGIPCTASY